MLHKKDFIKFAELLRMNDPRKSILKPNYRTERVFFNLCTGIAEILEASSPKFDKDLFFNHVYEIRKEK